MIVSDYEIRHGHPSDHAFNEVARHIGQIRQLIKAHGIADATICDMPMSVFKQVPPVTKRESMAACLLAAADNDITWKQALDRLRGSDSDAEFVGRYWRMADFAIEHIPYLDKLPDTEVKTDAERMAKEAYLAQRIAAGSGPYVGLTGQVNHPQVMQTPNGWRGA